MVKLVDIAKAAGVSPGTVSAALGGVGRCSPETKRRIRELARSMNYQPNHAARILRNKPAIDVGLVIADDQTRPVPFFVKWCERQHLRNQLELVCSKDYARLPFLLGDGVASGVLHVGYLSAPLRDFLAENPLYPLVTLNEKSEYCVRGNFASGTRTAIQYLKAMGHEHLAVFTSDRKYDQHCQIVKGLDLALEEFYPETTPYRSVILPVADYSVWMQNGVEQMRAALDRNPRPTAFFCSSMIEARALIYAAGERSLRVPEDLSIIAVGTPDDAASTYPAITALEHDFEMEVTQAMLLLQNRIAGEELPPQDILVDTRLVLRRSTKRYQGGN